MTTFKLKKNKASATNLKKLSLGFTLVEIMVAVSLFSVIMVISAGSIMSVFDANWKSQSLRTVTDNVSLTIESMVRNIRFGTNYHCDITTGTRTAPLDCTDGRGSLEFRTSDGDQVAYFLSNGRIVRTVNSGSEYYLTSSDTTITNLTFWVEGAPPYNNGSNLLQPRVIIVIKGFAGGKPSTQSEFTLQTAVSQRTFDFQ